MCPRCPSQGLRNPEAGLPDNVIHGVCREDPGTSVTSSVALSHLKNVNKNPDPI